MKNEYLYEKGRLKIIFYVVSTDKYRLLGCIKMNAMDIQHIDNRLACAVLYRIRPVKLFSLRLEPL